MSETCVAKVKNNAIIADKGKLKKCQILANESVEARYSADIGFKIFQIFLKPNLKYSLQCYKQF